MVTLEYDDLLTQKNSNNFNCLPNTNLFLTYGLMCEDRDQKSPY